MNDFDFEDVLNTESKPINEQDENLLFSLTPSQFKSFIEIISSMSKDEYISIKDSKITQMIANGIVNVDIKKLVGSNINLKILAPDKKIKNLKKIAAIKDECDILFINDNEHERIIINRGPYNLFIPNNWDEDKEIGLPQFENIKLLGKPIIISKDMAANITSFFQNRDIKDDVKAKYQLLFYNEQLKCINIQGTVNVLIPPYENEKIDETNSDMILKSNSFLVIDGESYKIYVAKIDDSGDNSYIYWMRTIINSGIKLEDDTTLNIEYYEQLDENLTQDLF